jgi:hypothetical protein
MLAAFNFSHYENDFFQSFIYETHCGLLRISANPMGFTPKP